MWAYRCVMGKGIMRIMGGATLFLAVVGGAVAADLGTPPLRGEMPAASLFDDKRFLTTGGVAVGADRTFTLTPQFGIGYLSRGREARPGIAESLYAINAQAGGRLDLLESLYFSATTKLPVYSYDVQDRRLASIYSSQERTSRHQYDLFRSPRESLSWTGEVGLKLGSQVDFNLFYDQSRLNNSAPSRVTPGQSDERFGTRFIIHFK